MEGNTMIRNTCYGLLHVLLTIGITAACSSSAGSNPGAAESRLPEDDTVRSTRFGQVKGIEAAADTWAWLGVPYAKPPVGTLRWKAPQEPDSWEGQLPVD